tara:strand:+ start:1367 stop:2671 length:1305 start_codon:yes stop_codon:yes gene_type:complete
MSLKKSSISGIKWVTSSTLIVTFSAIIKISILSRILDVSDFGLMAIVTFLLGFTTLFIDLGLTTAILHIDKISKKQYSSLFWLNVGFSVMLFGLLFFCAHFISEYYNELELEILIPLMAFGLVINALGSHYKTIEQKRLNFKLLALVDISAAIISLLVAVNFAVYGFGVYSLVYSSLLYTFLGSMFFFLRGMSKMRIELHFNTHDVKPFLKIGVFNIGGQVINFFNKEIDILIVGNIFGTEVLGGYSLAKQLVDRPLRVIRPIVLKVMSPILSIMKSNQENLKSNYLKIVRSVSTISTPIYLMFILFAEPIVSLFYGSEYEHIILLVRIFSGYMFFVSLRIPLGSLIIATGKTNMEFYWSLSAFVFMPIAVLIGANFSVEGVAIGMTITNIIYFFPMWRFLISPLLKVDFKEYLKAHIFSFTNLNDILNGLIKK